MATTEPPPTYSPPPELLTVSGEPAGKLKSVLVRSTSSVCVPVVVASGYAVFPMAPEKVAAILQKPITESQLLAALRPLVATKAL